MLTRNLLILLALRFQAANGSAIRGQLCEIGHTYRAHLQAVDLQGFAAAQYSQVIDNTHVFPQM